MLAKFGVTEYGFRRKLFSEIVEELHVRARDAFGVKIDLSDTAFLGQLLSLVAWHETELWEQIENVYYSAFVGSAEGTNLDNVGMYLTITRRPATKSKGIITVFGKNGTNIPAGFRVATKDGIMFETLIDGFILESKVDIPIKSIGAGKGNNVAAKTITEIINPAIGITSVINNEQTEGGMDIETDEEFRTRYEKSYARGGGSTVPAIRAALLDIDNVADAEVRENTTMETVDGIPAKSFECHLFGGDDEEVAQAIYKNKAAGIQAYGTTVIDVEDEKGSIHKIGFTRATVQNIYVKLVITKGEGFKGEDAIKRAVINYIGGIDDDGIEYNGLKLEKDVILAKVMGSVMCLGGIADVEVWLSKNGVDYVQENIEIAKSQIARTSTDKVVIEYV